MTHLVPLTHNFQVFSFWCAIIHWSIRIWYWVWSSLNGLQVGTTTSHLICWPAYLPNILIVYHKSWNPSNANSRTIREGFKIPTFKIPMFKIPMNQNTNRPYQNTNGPYQNTNKHYQNTNNAFSKYQRRKFIIPTFKFTISKYQQTLSKYQWTLWSCSKYQYLKFIISKYQQPYQNTNRPYDHVQNTNRPYAHVHNTNPNPGTQNKQGWYC